MPDTTPTDPAYDAAADTVGVAELAGRRRFLTRGAAAAAAAAAAGLVMSRPAEAANGDTVLVGASHTGTTVTAFTVTGSANALAGTTASGSGVRGTSASGAGVRGDGTPGVLGESTSTSIGGTGVLGRTAIGNGVYGVADNSSFAGIGVRARSTLGPSLFLEDGPTAPPTGGTWTQGSFIQDNGHIWYCYVTGSPGRWVKLSGAPVVLPASYRCWDSRGGVDAVPGQGPAVTEKFNDGTTHLIDCKIGTIAVSGRVPAGVSALILNLTATATSAAGFFGLYKGGIAWPGTSTLNWSAVNTNIANSTIVACDTLSRVNVRTAGSAHCIIDVIGYLP